MEMYLSALALVVLVGGAFEYFEHRAQRKEQLRKQQNVDFPGLNNWQD
ncbi:hypothetical protein CSE45_1467 [Citreicella sp. SE45]|nr:hypothetical protein CSE45_1467 [Citreicella sp. SE45]